MPTIPAKDDGFYYGTVMKQAARAIKSEPANESGISSVIARQLEDYFQAHDGGLPAPGLYARILREVERPLISQALDATGGNQVKAAELLGLNRNTLRKKIRELGIDTERKS